MQEGDVTIEFVGTASNVANILTKPLKGVSTAHLTRLLGLEMPSKGEVEDVLAFQPGCASIS